MVTVAQNRQIIAAISGDSSFARKPVHFPSGVNSKAIVTPSILARSSNVVDIFVFSVSVQTKKFRAMGEDAA